MVIIKTADFREALGAAGLDARAAILTLTEGPSTPKRRSPRRERFLAELEARGYRVEAIASVAGASRPANP